MAADLAASPGRWWVIEESQLLEALRRVQSGDDPSTVAIEFVANSDSEIVAEGIAPTCGDCGGSVRWVCTVCGAS
jgi:hypothetical protein